MKTTKEHSVIVKREERKSAEKEQTGEWSQKGKGGTEYGERGSGTLQITML